MGHIAKLKSHADHMMVNATNAITIIIITTALITDIITIDTIVKIITRYN